MAVVSVILNSYNQRRFLAEAIESVLSQTFRDFELIILDNGSTDGSADLVRGYSDARIVPLLRDDNQPISKRFNEALAVAGGEYVSFLYSDDFYLPSKLARQVEIFSELPADYGLVYGPAYGLNHLTGQRWDHPSVAASGAVLEYLLDRHHDGSINMISPLTRRRCFEGEPFHEDLFAEGESYWYRVAMRYKLHYDPERLVVMRDHGGNAGKALRKNHEMTMVCMERLVGHPDFPGAALPTVRRYEATMARDAGWSAVRLEGDLEWARRCFRAAVAADPRWALDPKVIFGLGLSYVPRWVRQRLNRVGSAMKKTPGNEQLVDGYRGGSEA